jgi:glycosyltransferase involved in cell wall biosynthesis
MTPVGLARMLSAVRVALARTWLSLRLQLHARLLRWLRGPSGAADRGRLIDMVLIGPPRSAPSWILGAFCKEIASRLPHRRTRITSAAERLPPAGCYFFSHYMFFAQSLLMCQRRPQGSAVLLFATHLEAEKHGLTDRQVARLLTLADGVLCMNSALISRLHQLGVPRGKLHLTIGAADSQLFLPHARQRDGLVGFSAAYYARKAPSLLLALVERMPHRRFVLLGKGWRDFEHFPALCAAPNFEYVETDYAHYPAWYGRMSVYVSLSLLEGGPIPLIEAMMCNVVPVASRTGFAPDIVQHGVNGFLFDVAAGVNEISRLVDQAFELEGDVAASAARFNWDAFAGQVDELMSSTVPPANAPMGKATPAQSQ